LPAPTPIICAGGYHDGELIFWFFISDIDGLYTALSHQDPAAEFIAVVEAITPEIEAIAGEAASGFSRGGMKTKLDAGKIATEAGTAHGDCIRQTIQFVAQEA